MRKRVLVFAVLIGVASFSQALTVQNILDRARVYLKDQGSGVNRQQFSDSTLISFINDGQRELCGSSWILENITTVALTNGTVEYTLPTDFISTKRVYINGVLLYQTTQNRLDAEIPTWRNDSSTTPAKYYLFYGSSTAKIGFYPKPDTSYTATVYYAQLPSEVATGSDTPFNANPVMTPYHSGLVYYVVCRGYEVLEEQEVAFNFCKEWNNFIQGAKAGFLVRPELNMGTSPPMGSGGAGGPAGGVPAGGQVQ